jgi:natural product precursor
MSFSLMKLNNMSKKDLEAIKGGSGEVKKVCGCICIGPIEIAASDEDCTYCGAVNAHKAENPGSVIE